jgi:hypothetical protein
MVDRGSQRMGGEYSCPACYSIPDAEPDDSLIKLFLTPQQVEESREADRLLAKLKSLEVFLDIPCSICGKPLPNTWKRNEVLYCFKRQEWAHSSCHNSS